MSFQFYLFIYLFKFFLFIFSEAKSKSRDFKLADPVFTKLFFIFLFMHLFSSRKPASITATYPFVFCHGEEQEQIFHSAQAVLRQPSAVLVAVCAGLMLGCCWHAHTYTYTHNYLQLFGLSQKMQCWYFIPNFKYCLGSL